MVIPIVVVAAIVGLAVMAVAILRQNPGPASKTHPKGSVVIILGGAVVSCLAIYGAAQLFHYLSQH